MNGAFRSTKPATNLGLSSKDSRSRRIVSSGGSFSGDVLGTFHSKLNITYKAT